MSIALCPRCKQDVDLQELQNGLCVACRAEIKARNAGKPKPRGAAKVRQVEIIRPADGQVLSLLVAGIKVPGTENAPFVNGPIKSITEIGNIVPGTIGQSADIDNKETISNEGHKVPGTSLEWQDHIAEDLAMALRRIKALEDQMKKLAPLIENEESKRDSGGMKKLRDELFVLLRKSPQGGVYVSSLHGPHGNKGGLLRISKTHAFRLRDVCRMDDRFRVEKAENSSEKWMIILNKKIK